MEWKEEDQVDENYESGNETGDEGDSNSNHDDDGDGDVEQTHHERVQFDINLISFLNFYSCKILIVHTSFRIQSDRN